MHMLLYAAEFKNAAFPKRVERIAKDRHFSLEGRVAGVQNQRGFGAKQAFRHAFAAIAIQKAVCDAGRMTRSIHPFKMAGVCPHHPDARCNDVVRRGEFIANNAEFQGETSAALSIFIGQQHGGNCSAYRS